jgi:hypothetical protein
MFPAEGDKSCDPLCIIVKPRSSDMVFILHWIQNQHRRDFKHRTSRYVLTCKYATACAELKLVSHPKISTCGPGNEEAGSLSHTFRRVHHENQSLSPLQRRPARSLIRILSCLRHLEPSKLRRSLRVVSNILKKGDDKKAVRWQNRTTPPTGSCRANSDHISPCYTSTWLDNPSHNGASARTVDS